MCVICLQSSCLFAGRKLIRERTFSEVRRSFSHGNWHRYGETSHHEARKSGHFQRGKSPRSHSRGGRMANSLRCNMCRHNAKKNDKVTRYILRIWQGGLWWIWKRSHHHGLPDVLHESRVYPLQIALQGPFYLLTSSSRSNRREFARMKRKAWQGMLFNREKAVIVPRYDSTRGFKIDESRRSRRGHVTAL